LQEGYDLPTDGLAPFPPRKFFNNLSPDFVQQRSLEIETYLNSLLLHYTLPPPPLANFIDWNKYLYGSLEKLHNSNIAINSLTFDLSPFKSLDYLELSNVEMRRMRGFESFKSSVTQLVVSRSLKNLNATGDGDWVYGENPVSTLPWDCIRTANFSNNFINKIDQTIALLPNVEILDLSSNLLTELPDFTSLTRLRVLFLSNNQLYIKEEPNLLALEPIEEECGIPEAIVISSASAGTAESGGNRSISPIKPIPPLRERLGEVQVLILANNGLRSASIVEGILSLQHLDLSGNKIESFDELVCLGDLPHLNSLELLGNPICECLYYRRNVLNILGPRFPLIVLDGHRVTAKECENVRLFQALMKGGVVTQLSPNLQTSVAKLHTRSTESSTNQPQNQNVGVVCSSPIPNVTVDEDQHFSEVSKSQLKKLNNVTALDQQHENGEVSTNIPKQFDASNGTIPQEVTADVLNQATMKFPIVPVSLTSSTRIEVSSDQPGDFAWNFSTSEVVSSDQPFGSTFYECSGMNTDEVTNKFSGPHTSDIVIEQVDRSIAPNVEAAQTSIVNDIDRSLKTTDKLESVNISDVTSAFSSAQVSTNASKQTDALDIKDVTDESYDISEQIGNRDGIASKSLDSFKELDSKDNSLDQSALPNKSDYLVNEPSFVLDQKRLSGGFSDHDSSNDEDQNMESVLSIVSHDKMLESEARHLEAVSSPQNSQQ
uniref:Nischarin n=1 Tax=Hymenolepis diminuta TaxID=6216 RepID=A0A0R3SI59_HYMDI